MAELTDPVVRRKAGDPLLYLFGRKSDGWAGQSMAFQSLRDIERAGYIVGAWRTDEHGKFAPAERTD